MRESRARRHWSRRTASVPKGYLRSRVLKMLDEQPMSGAEIIREIENSTSMRWKPSPGSIYPLLSWLLDSGYTRELTDSEAGVRRYELTAEGKKFLEEDKQRMAQEDGNWFFGPQFNGFDGSIPEDAHDLIESWRKMRRAMFALRKTLRNNYSESLVAEVKETVDDFVEKISSLSDNQRM
jgi:DNA-binding PadR family transcriptional regulator